MGVMGNREALEFAFSYFGISLFEFSLVFGAFSRCAYPGSCSGPSGSGRPGRAAALQAPQPFGRGTQPGGCRIACRLPTPQQV